MSAPGEPENWRRYVAAFGEERARLLSEAENTVAKLHSQSGPVAENPGFASIRSRIGQLEIQLANYRAYQDDRVAERDHHGAWDVAINMSETECEIAGLRFALEAMGAK